MSGRIVSGALSPHPPHLIYAENPPQNEPRSSGAGAWESLSDAYIKLRASIESKDVDVIIIHTPHWKTVVGTHLLGRPHFKSHSVDPIFPNLFRYSYNIEIDVELSEAIAAEGAKRGLNMTMMTNPDFRVDYGTITSAHLARPQWDKKLVVISSSRAYTYFNNEYGDQEMMALGEATRAAVEATGRKALLLASTSLSHRHFTDEPEDPEDPRFEHIYNSNQAAWDERILNLIKQGKSAQLLAEMPDFIEQANSECQDGGLTWLLSALEVPDYPGEVYGYGTVIGTGNAVVEWTPKADQ